MIEDIWSNFDNYKLQSQVMLKRQQIAPSLERSVKKFEDEMDCLVEPSQKVVELRRQSSSIKSVPSQCTRVN